MYIKIYIILLALVSTKMCSQKQIDISFNKHHINNNNKITLPDSTTIHFKTDTLRGLITMKNRTNQFIDSIEVTPYISTIYVPKTNYGFYIWKTNYENYPITKLYSYNNDEINFLGQFIAIDSNKNESYNYDIEDINLQIKDNKICISFNKDVKIMDENWSWKQHKPDDLELEFEINNKQ